MFLRFEPIVDAASQSVQALEAHVCWNHATRGVIDEEEFAQIVEGSSQIGEVGIWAITEACRRAALWPDSVRVAVNVPVPLFLADGFVEQVSEAIEAAGLSASRIELEISEAVFFGDSSIVDRTLGGLFKLGVRLTLDEFGSGYSSLAHLRRAPFWRRSRLGSWKLVAAQRRGRVSLDAPHVRVALAARAGRRMAIANGIRTRQLCATALGERGVRCSGRPIFCEPVDAGIVEQEMAGDMRKIDPGERRTCRASAAYRVPQGARSRCSTMTMPAR